MVLISTRSKMVNLHGAPRSSRWVLPSCSFSTLSSVRSPRSSAHWPTREQAATPPSDPAGRRGAAALGVPAPRSSVAPRLERHRRRNTPFPALRPPCASLVAQITHAITIHAPAGEAWRWLVQLGQGRGTVRTIGSRTWRTWTYIALKRSTPSCRTSRLATWYGLRRESGRRSRLRVAVLEPGHPRPPPARRPRHRAPARPRRSEPGPILRLELGVRPGRSGSGNHAADRAQPGRRQAPVPDQGVLHAAPGVPHFVMERRTAKA